MRNTFAVSLLSASLAIAGTSALAGCMHGLTSAAAPSSSLAQGGTCARNNQAPQRGPNHTLLASVGGPIFPTSWTIPGWFFDPLNVTLCADDANTCTSATCGGAGSGVGPCLTYGQVAYRWGTYSPRLRQGTILTWLSSDNGNTDPVYLNPYVEGSSASIFLEGLLNSTTQLATGPLGAVTARDRSLGVEQLYQTASIPGGSALGRFVVDSTAGARFWQHATAPINFSQPITAVTVPGKGQSSPEVVINTGDTVTIYGLSKINLVEFEPIIEQVALAPQTSEAIVYNLTVASPDGFDASVLKVNQWVSFFESFVQRIIQDTPQPSAFWGWNGTWTNSYMPAGATGGGQSGSYLSGAGSFVCTPWAISGQLGSTSLPGGGNSQVNMSGGCYTGDIIIEPGGFGKFSILDNAEIDLVNLGSHPLGTSTTLVMKSLLPAVYPGGPILWGSSSLGVLGPGKVIYPTGAGAAVAAFHQNALFSVNGSTTGCSSNGAATALISCNIPFTAPNLDLANSGPSTGFAGNGFVLGGGSISNTPF